MSYTNRRTTKSKAYQYVYQISAIAIEKGLDKEKQRAELIRTATFSSTVTIKQDTDLIKLFNSNITNTAILDGQGKKAPSYWIIEWSPAADLCGYGHQG